MDVVDLSKEADFRLGPWMVRPSLSELSLDGASTRLEPKVMQVLVALAASAGRTVGKDELLDRCWGHRNVSPDVLTRCISLLRRSLAMAPDDAARVEVRTIPRIGYSLTVAGGEPAPDQSVGDSAAATPAEESPPPLPAPVHARRGFRPTARALLLSGVAVPVLAAAAWMLFAGTGAGNAPPSPPRIGEVRPFTTDLGAEFNPAPAPGGGVVVYARASGPVDYDLFEQAVVEGTVRQLTSGPDRDFAPAWSPDGSRLAFLRDRPGEPCRVYMIARPGDQARQIGRCDGPLRVPAAAGLTWIDNETLVFSEGMADGTPDRLALLSLRDGVKTALTVPAGAKGGDWMPRYSQRLDSIAFVRDTGASEARIHLVNVRTRAVTVLPQVYPLVRDLSWDAAQQALLVSTIRDGRPGVRWTPVDGSSCSPISFSGIEVGRIAPLGADALLVESIEMTTRMMARPTAPDMPPVELVASRSFDTFPEWSPDGRTVAFASGRTGGAELWTVEADGQPRRVSHVDAARILAIRWSFDGRFVAFIATVKGATDIYVADTATLTTERVTGDGGSKRMVAWLPDGGLLYAGSRDGEWRVFQAERNGDTPSRAVTGPGVYGVATHPDSRHVYLELEKGGYARRPVADLSRADEVVQAAGASPGYSQWTLVGDTIYGTRFNNAQPTAVDVFTLETGSGEENLVTQLEGGTMGPLGFSVRPGSREIAYPMHDLTIDLATASLY